MSPKGDSAERPCAMKLVPQVTQKELKEVTVITYKRRRSRMDHVPVSIAPSTHLLNPVDHDEVQSMSGPQPKTTGVEFVIHDDMTDRREILVNTGRISQQIITYKRRKATTSRVEDLSSNIRQTPSIDNPITNSSSAVLASTIGWVPPILRGSTRK